MLLPTLTADDFSIAMSIGGGVIEVKKLESVFTYCQ
jgi:hypothetical protein